MEKNARDLEWMDTYLAGDAEGFERLYQTYKPKVLAYLKVRGLSPQDAEDVTQAVFLKFHRLRHSFQRDTPVAAWIFLLSKSQWIDFLRTHVRREHEFNEESMSPATSTNLGAPSVAMDGISSADQELLKLKYLEGHTFKEISKHMGVSEPGLRKRISRLIQGLRKREG